MSVTSRIRKLQLPCLRLFENRLSKNTQNEFGLFPGLVSAWNNEVAARFDLKPCYDFARICELRDGHWTIRCEEITLHQALGVWSDLKEDPSNHICHLIFYRQ